MSNANPSDFWTGLFLAFSIGIILWAFMTALFWWLLF